MKYAAFVVGTLLHGVVASPAPSYRVHERRSTLHSRSIKTEPAPADVFVAASIALRQNNIEKADSLLLEISDPDSPKYGEHLSAQEIIDLFAPSEDSIDKVKTWLKSSGVRDDLIQVSKGKNWVHFNTTVGHLNSLVQADYHQYSARDTSKWFLGAESYSLPTSISDIVDFLSPGTEVYSLRRSGKQAEKGLAKRRTDPIEPDTIDPESLKTCDMYMTPKCIRAMYDIPLAALAQEGNELGIFEENEDYYVQDDLDQFFAAMDKRIAKGTGPTVHNIYGATAGTPPSKPGPESDLDFEVAIPIIYPQKTSLYQIGYNALQDKDSFDFFLDAFVGPYCHDNGDEGDPKVTCNKLKQPNVVSISWGTPEDSYGYAKYKRQCTEWMKFGLAGTSVFAASGDTGVESGPCLGPDHDIFGVDALNACPYVTSVGATRLPKGSKPGDREVLSETFATGGGFSNLFRRPSWQHDDVPAYLDKYVPYKSYNTSDGKIPDKPGSGIYNRGGRGYPDLAAVGEEGVVVTGGKMFLQYGTSMSAPIVAAMFNRVNEERIHAGKKPLGFLNPALYKHAARHIFTDVVVGDQTPFNATCGSARGFVAAPGWDAVSGLGTPNYKKLLKYFAAL